jgi:hypothetical protein
MIPTSPIALGASFILVALAAFIIRSLSGAASAILADEFKASAPSAAQWIIRRAARRIPEKARVDMLETWLAEASQYEKRPLKALRFALFNCLAAAPLLARELRLVMEAEGTKRRDNRQEQHREETTRSQGESGPHISPFTTFRNLLRELVRVWTALLRQSLGLVSAGAISTLREILRQSRTGAALLGEVAIETLRLLEPYDYTREWRSLAQLLARLLLLIVSLPLIIGLIFWLFEHFLGL